MKRTSLFCSLILLAIVLGAGSGCSRKADDAKISSEIQARFSQDSGLSTKQISVQSVSGVVTLDGAVDNTTQRDAAGRQAGSVAGVTTVVNNLVVGAANASASARPAGVTKPAPSVAASARKTPASKNSRVQKRGSSPELSSAADSQEADNSQPAADAQPASAAAETASNTPPPPPAPPAPKQLIVDQGTAMAVRLIESIDSEKNQVGDTFHATLNAPLSSDGEQAVPAGVEVTGHIVEVKSASKFAGQSVLALQLDVLAFGGKNYNLQTDQYRKEGKARGKSTAEKVGGGAVLGTIIGAVAGGGKGAAIGAAAGAGAGGAVQAASKSQAIKLPSETVLNFTLQQPITVIEPPSSDTNRQKLNESQ